MAFNINALTLSATPRDFLLARQALAAADDAAAVGDGQATAFVVSNLMFALQFRRKLRGFFK